MNVTITALGLAAIKISDGHTSIYVDALIDFQKHPIGPINYNDANIILITHDHADHYSAPEVANIAKQTGSIIIGPPSIAYDLLVNYSIPSDQLKILYHQDPGSPVSVIIGNTTIHAYSSRHFSDGDNMTIHNSYLIEMGQKKLYITGDSNIITEKDKRLFKLDALLVNFVTFNSGKLKLSVLDELDSKYSPHVLAPIHLIGCDWTIHPIELDIEVMKQGLGNIKVMKEKMNSIEV